MLHQKLIDATIPVRNPINFCADKRRHALIHLKNTFEGKCFKGGYIVSIDEIAKISDCRIVSTNHSAEGTIDVQFSATVAVFSQWDIIPGVRIVKSEQLIIGSTSGPEKGTQFGDPRDARVVVTVLPSAESKTARVEQTVVVRVVSAEHAPMQQHASVVGTLLTCERAHPVYRVRGSLDSSSALELMPLVSAIDRELGARESMYKNRRTDMMFFEILLYSFVRDKGLQAAADDFKIASEEGSPTWHGPPEAAMAVSAQIVNVLDLVKRAAGGRPQAMGDLWSRPLNLYRSSPHVARLRKSGAAPAGWQGAVDETPSVVLQIFLKSQLEFLFAVRSMVETYNTKALIDGHVNIWGAMRRAQFPVAAKTGTTPESSPAATKSSKT